MNLNTSASRKTTDNSLPRHLPGQLPRLNIQGAPKTKLNSPTASTNSLLQLPDIQSKEGFNNNALNLVSSPNIQNESDLTLNNKFSNNKFGLGTLSSIGSKDRTQDDVATVFNSYEKGQPLLDKYKHFQIKRHQFPKKESINKFSLHQGMSPQQSAFNQQSSKYLLSNDQSLKQIESMQLLPNDNSTNVLSPRRKYGLPHQIKSKQSDRMGEESSQSPRQSRISGVSYDIIASDRHKSKQLLRIVDRKIKDSGISQQLIDQIVIHQSNSSELERAIEASICGSSSVAGNNPIKIVQQEDYRQQQNYYEDILNDTNRQRKAAMLIKDIEGQIRKNIPEKRKPAMDDQKLQWIADYEQHEQSLQEQGKQDDGGYFDGSATKSSISDEQPKTKRRSPSLAHKAHENKSQQKKQLKDDMDSLNQDLVKQDLPQQSMGWPQTDKDDQNDTNDVPQDQRSRLSQSVTQNIPSNINQWSQEDEPSKLRRHDEDSQQHPSALGLSKLKKSVTIKVDDQDQSALQQAKQDPSNTQSKKYEIQIDASQVNITKSPGLNAESTNSPTSLGRSHPGSPSSRHEEGHKISKRKHKQMISLSKQNRIRKDQEKDQKRKMLGLASDAELSSSEKSEEETFEQKKDRVQRQKLNELRMMNKTNRKQALEQHNAKYLEPLDSVEEKRKWNLEIFLNRVSKDEEFPVGTIQNLLVIQMKEFEDKNKNKFTDSNMAKVFAKDELINGLCLLHCLKNDEIRQNKQNQEMILQNTKALLKAVKTVKQFQEKEVYVEETTTAGDVAEALRAKHAPQNRDNANASASSLSERKLRRRSEKRNELFQTQIFSKVIQQIIGDRFSKRQLQEQVTQLMQSNAASNQGLKKEIQILQDLINQRDKFKDEPRLDEYAQNKLNIIQNQIQEQEDIIYQKTKQNLVDYAGLNKADLSVQMFARKINLQNEFNQVCKYASNPKIEEDFGTNPMLQYFKKSNKNAFLPLPILSRISNKTLSLVNYRITDGQCLGLGDAMNGNSRLLSGLVLDGNGMRDDQFSKILKGMRKLDHVKTIIYKNNELQNKSVEHILPLLAKKKPQNLQELRIIACRIGGCITSQLIEQLVDQSTLTRLSLVQANISEDSFRNLCTYVQNNRNLRELDISSNRIRIRLMKVLLDILAQDRKLTSVNLSWNCLQNPQMTKVEASLEAKSNQKSEDVTDGQMSNLYQSLQVIPEEKDERASTQVSKSKLTEGKEGDGSIATQDQQQTQDAMQETVTQELAPIPKEPKDKKEGAGLESEAEKIKRVREKEERKFNKELGDSLCRIIKYNQQLQHFDLSNTGLGDALIRRIGTALNKARSLASLHLSGNPGLSNRNLDFIHKRIRCKQPQRTKPAEDLNSLMDRCCIENEENNLSIEGIYRKHDNLSMQRKRELIQENLKLQHIKKSIQVHNNTMTMTVPDERKLEFVRFLGHKYDIPGSAQWKMFSDNLNTLQRCWICDQWIYSLIFWSQSIGDTLGFDYKQISFESRQRVIEKIIDKHPRIQPMNLDRPKDIAETRKLRQMTFYDEDEGRPLICAEFTNWEPIRMIRIDEFAQSVDSETTRNGVDIFDILHKKGRINSKLASKDHRELDDEEQREYFKLRGEMMQNYNKNWYEALSDELYYKQPHMGNGEYLNKVQHPQEEQLYVLPCFIRPGKQYYVVIQEDGLANQTDIDVKLPTDETNYYFHKDVVVNREEEIKAYSKPMKIVKKVRQFQHDQSVFKEWKQDTNQVVDRCFEHDSLYWKLPRFIKDPEQLERTKAVLRRVYPKLKHIFHHIISRSNFPAIGWLDFAAWAEKVKIPDERNCPQAAIDRAFIAANLQLEKTDGGNNPETALCRYEFMEIICRLAKTKYLDSGITKSLPDALNMLMTQNIDKYDDISQDWQGWRNRQLYTIPVNDLMEPNVPHLQTLYESFFDPRKKCMDLKDGHKLFHAATKLLAKEEYVTYCFGMSKMTVVSEMKDGAKKYAALAFPEFQEMVCRVADLRYSASAGEEYAKMPLETKIEFILDEIFPIIGAKRKDPVVIIEDESESDDDY